MEISTQFIVLVPVVLGVVQAIKMIGMPRKWSALVAVILGVGAVSLLDSFTGAHIIEGIVVGLSAAGLYSGTKSTVS